ncbi:amidase family protein [Caballeronia sp. LZ062]|uniref:amidase family protein n=1 Tax=unclassified Caballeronia TaxID=2646786 RepID=UPI00286069BC|nr:MULTISPECIES: amidase family protein [unclassified Caballeronia]MDR5856235.1 amidase family protein [Caballeronia sp. LZ050]MDR5872906.1 amidase family protein [Caballeronia sp. LZ062]
MPAHPAHAASAVALAAAYADGSADVEEVVRASLAAARQANTAFISIDESRALDEARAAAARRRDGRPSSALDGVPVAWKDLFDIAGSVTTAGSALFRNRAPASADAPLVATAVHAGLVGIGKTNLSEFAYSGLGLNPHFGTPFNAAFDATVEAGGHRAPGGSSSGAAIAVATGVVPIAVGTDTAGSIRVPAALNGVVGYRASRARYPQEGMAGLSRSADTVGPLARTVADCAAFDAVVRGREAMAALPDLRGARFVVPSGWHARFAVTDAVADNFMRFLARLAKAGARVDEVPVAAFDAACDLIRERGWFGSLEAFEAYRSVLDSDDAERIDQRVRTRLELSRNVPAPRLAELLAERARLIAQFDDELRGDTLVLPTVPHVAPECAPLEADPELFARVNLATLSMTMPGSFLDTPAIAMPTGADAAGLPTSVQLMRVQNDDDALIAVAQTVEQTVAVN